MSETMFTNLITRPTLCITESRKFQVMLIWSLSQVDGLKDPNVVDELFSSTDNLSVTKLNELRNCMSRLTRELKLYKIPPHELIKVGDC